MVKASISDIKNRLESLSVHELRMALGEYESDDRSGVRKLVERFSKKILAYNQELDRLFKMKAYERKYDDYNYICGIDEVGRGPLCGPVVSAAVVLPKDVDILYVNDSKKLSEKKREELYEIIYEKAIAIGVGIVNVDVIDEINILNATYKSMQEAIANLEITPQVILVDAVTIPDISIKQEAIIKGDSKSISIAAASIIAKVTRDHMLKTFDKLYPEYLLSKNKGYGTKEHIDALKKYGACPIHRKSFIKNII